MAIVIDNSRSIDATYTDLLGKMREIDLEEQSGASICVWCRRQKNEHLPDKRCSTWATSQYFTATRAKERSSVERGLQLIEELRRL